MANKQITTLTKKVHLTLSETETSVVTAIRNNGPLSRTELSKKLNYSRASMTSIINGLMEMDILHQVGTGESLGGRRPLILDINDTFGYVLGVDIGATSLDIALADFNGNILQRFSEPIEDLDNPEYFLNHVTEISQQLVTTQTITAEQIIGIGIGVPGPVEFSKGVLIAPPLMPQWESYSIKDHLNLAFPLARVIVDNDVNIMANGELHAGSGQGNQNFIYIKVGTGIGSGIVSNGEIYRGSNGCAGDVGHICIDYNGPICRCGNAGCLEAMAASPAIAERAIELARKRKSPYLTAQLQKKGFLTAVDVADAAARGDVAANEIIRDSGKMIGGMLATLVNFFNPETIIIGGGVSNIGYQLLASIRQAVLRRSSALSTRELHIEYSTLGADAGVVGAIWLVFEHIFVEK